MRPRGKRGSGKGKPRYEGKLVRITWHDASFTEGHSDLEDVPEGMTLRSYGVCVRESRMGLTLATDVPWRRHHQLRNFGFIPWSGIEKIRVYATEWKASRPAPLPRPD